MRCTVIGIRLAAAATAPAIDSAVSAALDRPWSRGCGRRSHVV